MNMIIQITTAIAMILSIIVPFGYYGKEIIAYCNLKFQ